MEKLYNKLFNFKIKDSDKICVSKNGIYSQLLLYLFYSTKKDLLLVYSSLNEATNIYNELKNYTDSVYIFPEDDFMTKSAVATSPELLFLRLKLLTNISAEEKKIVIVHYNSFVKKLPNKNEYADNKLTIKKGKTYNRELLVKKLIDIGYKRESLVMNTSEFAVRGFVVDIFPIHEDNPIRIELFDDEVESIKHFDGYTQLSKEDDSLDIIEINALKDKFDDNYSSILEYLNEPLVVFNDINEIKKVEKMMEPQINYLKIENEVFKIKDLIDKSNVYLNTIDNGDCDIKIIAKTISSYNGNKDSFYDDIKKFEGTLYTKNKSLSSKMKDINIKEDYLSQGFVYNDKYYFSDNDLFGEKSHNELVSGYKYGNKVDSIDKLKIGDYVVHRKSGIGIYQGLITIEKNGIKKDYILIQYKGNDKLYLPVENIEKLYKYTSKEGAKPTIHKLNSIEWVKTKLRIKERIKSITGELLKIYKSRSVATVLPFNKDDESQVVFESEFQYEVTTDQYRCAEEIKRDLEKTHPMERLLCGDVGYGKTEVIFRAIYKTIINGKQVAYLCPTTILSHQQYASALDRFKNHGINIDLVNRHYSNKEVQEKLRKLKEGKTDIIFGTHRLLSKDVVFNDLGLLIIDEEHRFGVEQKERIKAIKSNVHVLSVSATPIPRSLQMALVGIRDMSLIESAPKNRYPVQTYVIEHNEMLIREAVLKEISRGGQVFILYNNVMNMEKTFEKYIKLIPEVRFCYAHGKMSKNDMQDIIYDFTNHKYDVLLSTTIIENGIDIPNANTIIVIDSDRFGLSQLYQIRGRVGRSDRIAYAYLMYKREKILTSVAIKRLEAIKEFTELGSGYKISMRDLSIRGAGDILGSEQAGFIDSVGVDMYLDLINEEVNGIEYNDDENDVLPLDVETHINEELSEENSVIIELHKKINGITTYCELKLVLDEIKDRFGKTNEQLQIYAYEKYYEKLLVASSVSVFENNNLKIVFRFKPELYESINVEELFVSTTRITTKFNFQYKNKFIYITLLKANLDKHYVYYCVEFLELVRKLQNKL